jgi:hypothetical protein
LKIKGLFRICIFISFSISFSVLYDRRQLHFPSDDNYTSLIHSLIIDIIPSLSMAFAGYFFTPAFAGLWKKSPGGIPLTIPMASIAVAAAWTQ